MAPTDTKHRILDAAESLFATQGFAATSLRAITTRAGTNLAAVNYHFGSKESLFVACFSRRIGPINDQRMSRLDQLEAEAPPKLEALLEAFLRPPLELARTNDGARFMQLAGRVFTEPGDHWERIAPQFEVVRRRFLAALQRALPELPAVDLFWRVSFMIGTMSHTLADTHRLLLISDGLCDPTDIDGVIGQMVPFLAAGFRAPLPAHHEDQR